MFVTPISRKSTGLFIFTLFALLGLYSCDDDNGNSVVDNNDFDRAAMLESAASKLIIPNFQSLQSSVNELSSAANAFVQTTTEENLTALKAAWVKSVMDHQHCSAFGFGPAELLLGPYAEVLGVFPVSESKVEENILNPDFDLPNSFDKDVRGFYAVEYLIYGNGKSSSEVVASFDQNRKDYLLLILDELKSTFDRVVSEWNSSYLQEFIDSDGTAAGSSISLYYNEFVKDYENLKNFKLELPAGLTADQEGPDGTLVEAFYSGISRDLVVEHFENSKNIWLGLSRSGEEIIGFDAYLESVVGGPELVTQTKEAITQIDNAIASLPQGRLSDNAGSNEVKVLRDELQDNTANFKSSLSSLLGISITFNSGDGD
ncbi:MAG: imelysin family protein [Bacteroidota bacterium]